MRSAAPWRDSPARTVYVAYLRVRFHEIDPLGHVNNAVYLNYLEQAAIDHATALGFGMDHLAKLGGTFIARRHEIDYLTPAVAGDWLRVTTWPVELSGARAVRNYEITRLVDEERMDRPPADQMWKRDDAPIPLGDVVLRASTIWAYVSPITGRPQRMPVAMTEAFVTRDET